jgi:hypothetical protein
MYLHSTLCDHVLYEYGEKLLPWQYRLYTINRNSPPVSAPNLKPSWYKYPSILVLHSMRDLIAEYQQLELTVASN